MIKEIGRRKTDKTLLLKLCSRYDPDAEDSIIWAINELENHMDTYSIASFRIAHRTGQWLCEIMLGLNDDPEWHGTQKKYCLSLLIGDDWVLDNYWFDNDISKETFDEFVTKIDDICSGSGRALIRKDEY